MAAGSSERRPAVALVALGCRAAQADVDLVAAALGSGCDLVEDVAAADCVVVSACTVTADADRAARQAIGRAARARPDARVVVMGCYAARAPEVAAMPGVAAVVGATGEAGVPAVLAAIRGPSAHASPLDFGANGDREPRRARPLLKVQDGCDARCSYCVVPLARGPSRSLSLDEALGRLDALAARHAEVVLTGVHLGAYGRDLAPRRSLADLLRAAAARGLASRLRLSSIEPDELPLELLGEPAGARLCPHLHLPLQSGSDRILARMRRPYRAEAFRAVALEAARRVPGLCLGADVMTGFPGETDADHRATLALVEALPLAYLHVFPFSPRAGTDGARLDGAVPREVARARAAELLALSGRRWRAHVDGLLGREVEAVVERVAGGVARGTAAEWATVRWAAAGEPRGALARVRITGRDGDEAVGERVRA